MVGALFDVGTTAACYGFRHALYQQVVYGKLPAGRRSALHRRIGARLRAACDEQSGNIVAELAGYFQEGSVTHGTLSTVEEIRR